MLSAFKTLRDTFLTYLILSEEGLFLQRRQISANEAVEILKGEGLLVLRDKVKQVTVVNAQALNEKPGSALGSDIPTTEVIKV